MEALLAAAVNDALAAVDEGCIDYSEEEQQQSDPGLFGGEDSELLRAVRTGTDQAQLAKKQLEYAEQEKELVRMRRELNAKLMKAQEDEMDKEVELMREAELQKQQLKVVEDT